MQHLPFAFADRGTVPGYIGSDCANDVVNHIVDLKPDMVLLVIDSGAWEHHSSYLSPLFSPEDGKQMPVVKKFMLPGTDECKSWQHLTNLIRWSFDVGATKASVITAFGGGALLNVCGLFASIVFRGSKLVYVPTTFLAMHDVVTSLKTSICFDGRKNNIGSFYMPLKILIDMAFCRTLPAKELMSGLGELCKNALILGGDHAKGFIQALSDDANSSTGEDFRLDDQTLLTLTALGIDAKMKMLAHDPLEKTTAMIFEYGHTVAHAIEKGYGDGTIPHGIGVAYGMLSSSYAAEEMGIMSPEDRKEHDAVAWLLLKRWPLPEPRPSIERIMRFAMRDSKRGITAEASDEISDVIMRKMGEHIPTKTNNLSKFPNKYVFQWLYKMGFPHEAQAQPNADDATLTSEDCKELLESIRTGTEKDLKGKGYETMTCRFDNNVWATKVKGQDLVLKRYKETTMMRVDADAVGRVDVLAGENGVGPPVLHASPQGLVMQRLDGRSLEEADMHKHDVGLLEKIAAVLAKLHQLPVPSPCQGEPMLWRSIDKMMEVASRNAKLWPDGVPPAVDISEEAKKARTALDKWNPVIVLCHGDLLPSSVILSKDGKEVHLIDNELAGPNYRAFDIMKIFRTSEKQSEASMKHFVKTYIEKKSIWRRHLALGTSSQEIAEVIEETKLFEPLTWLEAACFFLALPYYKPDERSRWNALALDRWQKYEATKHLLEKEKKTREAATPKKRKASSQLQEDGKRKMTYRIRRFSRQS